MRHTQIGCCLLIVNHEVSTLKLGQLTDLLNYEDVCSIGIVLLEELIFGLSDMSVKWRCDPGKGTYNILLILLHIIREVRKKLPNLCSISTALISSPHLFTPLTLFSFPFAGVIIATT